jgi:ribosome-binding factor A
MAGVSPLTVERAGRVAEAIKAEVSDIMRNDMKDPRIGFASVVDVEVSRDLHHARVFVSVLGDEAARKATLEGLESARGFIRGEIARRIRLRYAPEIEFRLDTSIERGARISRLLREVGPEKGGPEGTPGGESGTE